MRYDKLLSTSLSPDLQKQDHVKDMSVDPSTGRRLVITFERSNRIELFSLEKRAPLALGHDETLQSM